MTSISNPKVSDFSLGFLFKSFMVSLKSWGWKSHVLNAWTDQRLQQTNYRQWLWVLSQSHWSGFFWFILVSLISFLTAQQGFWTPVWRESMQGVGLEIALSLADGRLSQVLILGSVTALISFCLAYFGISAIWFPALVPGLLYVNLISTSFAMSGLIWCWVGSQLYLLTLNFDSTYRRDFSRTFILGILGAVTISYLSLIYRDLIHLFFPGSLFHQPVLRFILWLISVGLGLFVLSVIHAAFFHFYFKKYAHEETPMNWNIPRSFFQRVDGAVSKKTLLNEARTRLAERQKIAQDLDEQTIKKLPASVLSRWEKEKKSVEDFVSHFSKS